MTKPTFDEEQLLWQQGIKHIAGVDEVGRGCFAGPVVAAAVILPRSFPRMDEVNDSKKLSATKREQLAAIIQEYATSFSIAEIAVETINQVGIGKAAQQAFHKAVSDLHIPAEFILMDAFFIETIAHDIQKPIIRGDGISISIAAASIIAKVYRDKLMQSLHEKYQVYDFATNKGYGTKKHREAIKQYGLCDLHRTSFNLTKFTSSV